MSAYAPEPRQGEHHLSADSLFDLAYVRDARFSPDGKWIAYAVSRTEGEVEHFEIFIRGAGGQEARQLHYEGNAGVPRWSPDGQFLAFIGDGRLWIVKFPQLEQAEALTPTQFTVQGAPTWAPDGAHLGVCLSRRVAATGPRRIRDGHFRSEGLGFTAEATQHLYTVARAGGGLRCLTPEEGICSQPEWSPNGKYILFLATEAAIPYAAYSPRLLTVEVESGKVERVLGEPWYVASARWVNGERIAVVGAKASSLTIPTLYIWLIDRTGGKESLRTGNDAGSVGFWNHHDMPVWEFMYGAQALAVLDEHVAFASVQRCAAVEIWRIGLNGDAKVERVITGDRSCILLDVSAATDRLLFAETSIHEPTELCSANLFGEGREQLTDLNARVLARWPKVAMEPLRFKSTDGLEIDAWYLASVSRRKPLPTILFIHGGPFGATGHTFRFDFHLLASHGFGIVLANFRGSAGYGEPFVRAIMGDWGGNAYPDHIGAVMSAVERGLADEERLGVWGPSHGGFATCWVVGHSKLFKAAVAEASFTDFRSLYYLTDAPDVFARDLGGRPDEIPDVYRMRSPLTYAHRCTTPTLLLHGEDDLRCPISEAEQFFRALKDAGCETELLRIPRCTHLGDSIGPLSARRAQNEALLDWFTRYL